MAFIYSSIELYSDHTMGHKIHIKGYNRQPHNSNWLYMLRIELTKKITDLGQAALQAKDASDFKNQILPLLENIFGAQDSVFLDWEPIVSHERGWQNDDMFSYHWGTDHSNSYYQLFRQDPVYLWISSGQYRKDFNVARYSQLINYREIRKTEFYSKILKPLNCRYVLSMVINEGNDIIANISLLRTPDMHDFTESDAELARMIIPVINAAYQNILFEQESTVGNDILNMIVSRCQESAFVILSETLETIYKSDKFQQLFLPLKESGFRNLRELLFASKYIHKYLDLFAHCRHRRLPQHIDDTIDLNKLKNIHITVDFHSGVTENPYLIIGLDITDKQQPVHNLQQQYGLTLREVQIAQMASKGLTSQQMGEALCLSPYSIKSHLRNIYKKTGVNNRACLAKLV